MASKTVCVQCNGTDFFIESGFYFCSECQTQSQDVREEVQEKVFFGGQSVGHTTRVSAAPSKVSSVKNDVKDLTSWEVMNYVLKGLVDELIYLGCDKSIKPVVLQLWCAYLQKSEVAFISSHVEKKPRVGITFKTRDAEILFGTNKEVLKMYKRPLHRKAKSQSSVSSVGSSQVFSTKRLRLAKAVYEKSFQSSCSDISDVTLETLETKQTKKEEKFSYNKHAKETIKEIFTSISKQLEFDTDLKELQNGFINKERKSWRHMTLQQLVSIIRIALLIVPNNVVHLCDLFRWSQEGYFSVSNSEKLLPAGCSVVKDIKALLVQPFYSWLSINKHSSMLAQILGVTNINVNLLSLCERFIKDLQLPEDILPMVQKMLIIVKPQKGFCSRSNFEGRAAALIIFILKLLFGLDDSTEEFISDVANKINRVCFKKSGEKLFVWSKWCKFIECRSAVISLHHSPTRNVLYCGSSVGSARPFIGQWMKAPKKQLIKRVDEVKTEIAQGVNLVLGPLCCSGSEPLRPSVMHFSSLLRQIKERSISEQLAPVLDSYCNPLVKYCAAPFLDSDRMKKLAESCDFKVIEGSSKAFRRVEGYKHILLRPKSKNHSKVLSVNLVGDPDKPTTNYEDPDNLNPVKNEFHYSERNLAVRVSLEEQIEERETALYQPFYEYWLLHGDYYDSAITIPEFDEALRRSFPSSFVWLLRHFSLIAQQSSRDIYRQLMMIEKIYICHLERRKNELFKYW